MPFQILSDHPLPSSHPLLPTIEEKDSLKHIETLRARLGFARFKLNHGWESSTLLDVEQLWKQRQQKLTSGLPKPRFTQRDIIDKKIYIPSPGAKCQKAKKQKLLRTYSQPSLNIPKRKLSNFNTASSPKTLQPQQQQFLQPRREVVQQHERPSSSLSPASPPQHLYQNQNHYQQPKQRQQQQQQQNRHEEKESLYFHHYRHTPSPVWEDPAVDTHSSFSSSSSEGGDAPISSVRNSLDFLSYAIAITENNNNNGNSSHYHHHHHPPPPPPPPTQHHHHEYQHHQHFNEEEPSYSSQPLPDVSNLSPNLNDEDLSVQGNTEEPLSPPSSPVTSAAKAIMTFVNSQSNRPLYTL